MTRAGLTDETIEHWSRCLRHMEPSAETDRIEQAIEDELAARADELQRMEDNP